MYNIIGRYVLLNELYESSIQCITGDLKKKILCVQARADEVKLLSEFLMNTWDIL